MCIASKPQQSAAAPILADPRGREANRQADIETALRRRRAGAAASILTSPRGIPSTNQLGAAA